MIHKNLVLSLAATMTCLTSVSARENLLSDSRFTAPTVDTEVAGGWCHQTQRPAIGTVGRAKIAAQSDSVADLAVRYTSVVNTPAASMSQTLTALAPKKYRFGGFIKFDRTDCYLTLNVRLADGTSAGSLTVSSKDGDIVPGQWVRAELMVDLSDKTAEQLADVTFEFLPQYDGASSVVSDKARDIFITRPELFGADYEGTFAASVPVNGGFESWATAADGTRTLASWTTDNASRRSGVLGFDIAPMIKTGTKLTSEKISTESTRNKISLDARTDSQSAITITASIAGKSESKTIVGGAWQHIEFSVDQALSGEQITLTASGDVQIDNVQLQPIYGIDNPRPVERTLHVTSSANDGAGSLRDIVSQASSGDEIIIDVEKVSLTEAVSLNAKSITINGGGNKIEASGSCVFNVNNTAEGTTLTIKDLTVDCDASKSVQGSFLYIGDSTTKTSPSIIVDNVTINNAYASGNGGAIYGCIPDATIFITNSTFNGCKAGSGAAIATTGGTVTVSRCRFNDCTSTATTGGTVTNLNNRGDAMTISACRFDRCTSTATTGGGGAITVNNAGQYTYIDNCQFDSCGGGRANSVNVYNSSRYSGGETVIANCLMINSTSSPAVSVNGGSSYAAPTVYIINNIMSDNQGGDVTVTRGEVAGSNNMFTGGITGAELSGTTVSTSDKIFAKTENGKAVRDTDRDVYPILAQSAVHHTGVGEYVTALGVSVIPIEDINGLSRGDKPSLGPTEQTDFAAAVKDITVDSATAIDVRYNPVAHAIDIRGDFSRYVIVNAAGRTMMISNSTSVDTSAFAPGVYIIAFEQNGKTVSRKIAIR
jgi:hypothetical protein